MTNPTAPVQDDDAEWLRKHAHDLAYRGHSVFYDGGRAEAEKRLERIADRLSPTPEIGLVEALERAFIFICENCPLGPTNDRTAAGKLIDSLRVPLATAREAIANG
jgi:hypothetical protein